MSDIIIFNIFKYICLCFVICAPLNIATIYATENKYDAKTLFGWTRFIYPLYMLYLPFVVLINLLKNLFNIILLKPIDDDIINGDNFLSFIFFPVIIFFFGNCWFNMWLKIEDGSYGTLLFDTILGYAYFYFYAHVVALIRYMMKNNKGYFFEK